MGFGCLESLPLCSYDTESPEPPFAASDQLFVPVEHQTELLMVRDTGRLRELVSVNSGLNKNESQTLLCCHPAFKHKKCTNCV